MVNYLQLGQNLMKHFPLAEGCSSTIKLSKKGIEALGKRNPELGKLLSGLTDEIAEPTVVIAQKMKGNYGITGFKIRSDDSVISKGTYSISKAANDVVEKVHVESDGLITTISKEKGKINTKITDRDEIIDATKKLEPKVSKWSHEENVNSFFNRQADVIKGLDKNNNWIKQDLIHLSPKELKLLEEVMDDAAKKGIKIPYGKDYEYIEMLLPMSDGRNYPVKIFPGFCDGQIKMRIFLDRHIPNDSCKTYRDIGYPRHNGACHSIKPFWGVQDFKQGFRSDDVVERLTSRKKLADKIRDMWTEDDSIKFMEEYNWETRCFLKRGGIINSPLKPNF